LQRFVGAAPDDLLFVGEKGNPLRLHVLYKAWAKARNDLGRPELRIHDLRHSGATWAAGVGASTKELMNRLGQVSPNAALRYQHATEERDKAIADALAQRAALIPISSLRADSA
jgi:integrase